MKRNHSHARMLAFAFTILPSLLLGACGSDSSGEADAAGIVDADLVPTIDARPCPGVAANGHCYFEVLEPKSWDDAEADCVSKGGHLASMADLEENTFALSATIGNGWIGTTSSRTTWTDGSTLLFEAWRLAKTEDPAMCTAISGDGLWDEITCASPDAYLCEIVDEAF